MTKRTVEEIQKEIKKTQEEAFYYYRISRGVAYAIKDWAAAEEASRLFRRLTNLKRELNRAKIRDWGLRAKEPRKGGGIMAQLTLQEEVQRLYKRVCEELPPNGLFDDGFEHAFQALSEIIEYHGGGEHIDFL